MHPTDPLEIDELLASWGEGGREALRALIPVIYKKLCRAACQQLRRAPLPCPVQSAAFVHGQVHA
jgi:hypothetical protein